MFSINAERDFYKALFTVSEKIDGSYDNMILAGGACRDSLLDKNIKDFDVFILNPSKTLQNKIKKHAYKSANYSLGNNKNGDEVKYETWNINDNIQVILANNQNVDDLLKSFDYDFCQLGFTTDQVFATEAFENFYFQDDDINYVTLLGHSFDTIKGNMSVVNRLINFTNKFPEYQFRDNRGALLTNDLKKELIDTAKQSRGAHVRLVKLDWGEPVGVAQLIGGARGFDDVVIRDQARQEPVPQELNPEPAPAEDDILREEIARIRQRLNF